MKSSARIFRTINSALKARAAASNPDALTIVRVGDDYLLGAYSTLSEFAIIGSNGLITGHITMRHLERLGNGNWATPHESMKCSGSTVFYKG